MPQQGRRRSPRGRSRRPWTVAVLILAVGASTAAPADAWGSRSGAGPVGGRPPAWAPFSDPACIGIDCSGRGVCVAESGRALCLCDDGYSAVDRRCVPAPPAPDRPPRQRASTVRARIVDIAEAQVGKGPATVGADLADYPFALRRYVSPGDLWCTDFVSWVYKVAGTPLTGGAQGGWLIPNNVALRTWFERHGRWIGAGSRDWAGFEPRRGDYVRLHTLRGGHSGLVHHLDGDTLFTIEGNVSNRVRLRRHRDYKQDRLIDGFGVLALPGERLRDAR